MARTRPSSARNPTAQQGRVHLYVLLALLALVAFIVLKRRTPAPDPVLPTPTMTPSATASVSPTPPLTPTPTPTLVLMVLHSDEMIWPEATPSPTPLPTRQRSQPTPTPLVSECVKVSSSVDVATNLQTLVEVKVHNDCWRELDPFDVWFVANGYINGSLVHSVRGHPFDRIRHNHSESVTVVLPGAYDRVSVRILDP